MKKLLTLIVAALALAHTAFAVVDTSYLLIQGPFGISGSTKNFEWQVIYNHGSLNTSFDLVSAVFGTPVNTGQQFDDGVGGSYPIFSAGNNVLGASFIDFGGNSLFAISFTFDGVKVEQGDAYSTTWSLYAAGGGGPNGVDDTGPRTDYPSGAWNYSNDGVQFRTLADGSFDGWVIGPFGTTITDPNPLASNFTTAQVINLVPEPSTALLLVFGGLILRRRR